METAETTLLDKLQDIPVSTEATLLDEPRDVPILNVHVHVKRSIAETVSSWNQYQSCIELLFYALHAIYLSYSIFSHRAWSVQRKERE